MLKINIKLTRYRLNMMLEKITSSLVSYRILKIKRYILLTTTFVIKEERCTLKNASDRK